MSHQQSRHASALIMIMAILTLTVVLAFGTLAFVSEQRSWAQKKHTDSLIRHTLLSGRAHAQRVLEQAYDDARTAGAPTLPTQAWTTTFAATAAWPSTTSHALAASRQAARQTLADGAWGQANAHDLWRFESGLASPIALKDASSPHGHDDGWTSHDGTGRWFTVAWLDREFRPVDQAKASYQLRYAVAAVDLSGLLLANKARYEHVTPGGAGSRLLGTTYDVSTSDESARAIGTPGSTTRWAATSARPDVPIAGMPCPETDLPLGQDNDAVPTNRLRYNTWRPIPADHVFPAHMLLTIGSGMDDSTPRTLADGATPIGYAIGLDGKAGYYMRRTGGTLPDSWRKQGFQSVQLSYWQFSRRYSDFLPFDQNPHPVTTPDTYGTAWKTNYGNGNSQEPFLNAGKEPPTVNRHPAALVAALHTFQASTSEIGSYGARPDQTYPFPGDPYDRTLDQNARRAGDVWNQIDLPNWQALAQGLRLHRVYSGNTVVGGLPSLPSKADGMVQCWSPFGTTIARFADRGASDLRRKNDWEMRYQWTPDANTAPRQVLMDLIRLAVPEDTAGRSAESATEADRQLYEDYITGLANSLMSKRPFANGAAVVASAPTWSGDAATSRMLQSCVFGGDGSALQPNLGLGAGPRAEFEQVEWNTSADPFVVIKGRHVRRFWTALGITDRADAVYRLRGWRSGSGTVTADLWVDRTTGVGLTYGAEYVSGSPGAWVVDPAGTFTRVWLASTTGIDTAADRVVVHYPGASLTVGLSRWFRIAIRAELRDLDVPEASRDQSLDLVLHLDPDRSGAGGGTGMWDSDVPYSDLENPLQWRTSGGSVIW